MCQAFRNEHPELASTVTFDVEEADCSAKGLAKQLQYLQKQRAGGLTEPELASRGEGKLMVPRLVDSTQRLQNEAGDPSFGPEGMYIVTGGTGALGLLFVDWMVRCGARHFALLSRSGQPPADSKAAFRKLEKQMAKMKDVTFSARKCDIGSGADVLRVVTQVLDEQHVVKGIVHAAGTLADGLIKDGQDRATLKTVCSAKAGALTEMPASCHAWSLSAGGWILAAPQRGGPAGPATGGQKCFKEYEKKQRSIARLF